MVTCPAWVGGRIRLLACVPATASATSHIAQAQGTTNVQLFCTLIAATILTEPITMAIYRSLRQGHCLPHRRTTQHSTPLCNSIPTIVSQEIAIWLKLPSIPPSTTTASGSRQHPADVTPYALAEPAANRQLAHPR